MQTQSMLRRNVRCGLYTAMAMTLFLVEAQIPVPIPLPGIKLGLANSVSLLVMVLERPKDAFAVLLTRIILSGLFCGQPVMLLYSLCGGILSFCSMAVLQRFFWRNLWFVSMVGAVFHIIGQLTMAMLLLHTTVVLNYLPLLLLCAVPAGMFNGWVVGYTVGYVRKSQQNGHVTGK